MNDNLTRILVVEDHPQTRAGIRDYLAGQGMIVREASNTADAMQLIHEWRPQAVVLDIVIPPRSGAEVDLQHGDGIRAARLIKKHDPNTGVVLLSNHPYYRPELLELAGHGYGGLVYLFKGENPAHELRDAIRDAMHGRIVFDPQTSRSQSHRPDDVSRSLTAQEREKIEYAVSQMPELTQREIDVLAQAAASRTNGGIAKSLHITPDAVQAHLSHIYAKVGLSQSEGILNKRILLAKAYAIDRSRRR